MFPFFLSFYFISEYGGGSVTKSCPTLCESMDCSPPSSSVHGISQAKILEWVTISFSNKAFLSSLKRVIFTLHFISSVFGLLHHGARAG